MVVRLGLVTRQTSDRVGASGTEAVGRQQSPSSPPQGHSQHGNCLAVCADRSAAVQQTGKYALDESIYITKRKGKQAMTEHECNCPVCRGWREEEDNVDLSEITIEIPGSWFSRLPAGRVRAATRKRVFSHVRSFYPNAKVIFTQRTSPKLPTDCLESEIDRIIDEDRSAWDIAAHPDQWP